MPAFTPKSINDGLAVPVAHTFGPLNKEANVAIFVDRSPANAVGWKKIKHEIVSAKTPGAANRAKIEISDPVLATIDTVLTKVRTSTVQINLNFAQDSTDQERKDAVAYAINWLSNADVKTSIIQLEPFYS